VPTPAADTPLITVRSAPNTAVFRADAVASTQLGLDTALTAQAGSVTFPVVVSSIGDFTDGTNGQLPGRDIVLSSTDPAFLALPTGTPVTVLTAGADEEALAVPLTAIRQDNGGDYVNRRIVVEGKTSTERVAIEIERTGGGWAAILDGGIAEGDVVMLS
jgi:multidrug efflux pump subunit AcrA (membrane-fusion protein)